MSTKKKASAVELSRNIEEIRAIEKTIVAEISKGIRAAGIVGEAAPEIPKSVPQYLADRVLTWEHPSADNMSTHTVWLRKGWKFYSWRAVEIIHEANEGTVADMVDTLRRSEPCDCPACITAAGTPRKRAPGGGRKKSETPSIKFDTRQPAEVYAALREIGEGNISEGIRAAAEVALPVFRRRRAGKKAGGK